MGGKEGKGKRDTNSDNDCYGLTNFRVDHDGHVSDDGVGFVDGFWGRRTKEQSQRGQ